MERGVRLDDGVFVGGALEFLFDLGATIGKPTISMSATGPAATT